MKNYVAQLERLGYVLPQDLSVGLIMNGLTSDFAGFVRNYNKHNMGKTICELHALLIEYEKGLPKKAATPHIMAIQGGRIQKANKKSLNAKGKGKGKDESYIPKPKNPKSSAKEHPKKDNTYHHCKEVGHYMRNYLAYLAELIKKKKQVGTASSLDIFVIELFSFPTKSWVYDTGCEPPHEEVIPIRRFKRTHRAPTRLCLNVEAEEHSLRDLNEPTNYKVAMLDPESNKWLDAMNAEIQSMIDNMVWVLVNLPPNCKTIGSKWSFKKKTDMDGIVHTYKARLVAKGFTQTYGVDCEEIFSPFVDIRAIRNLIAIAAFYDYEIWQMDIKTTFLNGYLDEDIYMVNPEAELRVNCYCNAGFKTDRDKLKSKTGYVLILNGRRTASEAEMETVWIRKFISRLGIVPTINKPIKMFCDNSAALLIANEPRVQKDANQYHRIYLLKVHIDDNLPDPFMKALTKGKLTQHARSMGLRLASSFM
ncbi:retrotransposon protein, putative, ty1-copia subclass [Tanacetum coccineum]|uniref:Retrotransposon protein, putative, ty1-copia subclass n=1 Tax=Tanacetum coccineum TaxID=301880 RepID=A0ABQ5DPD6_9ASTR